MGLPDRGVGAHEAGLGVDQGDQDVGDLAGDHGPVLVGDAGVAAACLVDAQRPQEQAEAVELEVGAEAVEVGLLDAEAVVAHEADLVRRHAVGLELVPALEAAGLGLEIELERALGMAPEADRRQRGRGVGAVADPRVGPLAGREAGEHGPAAAVLDLRGQYHR